MDRNEKASFIIELTRFWMRNMYLNKFLRDFIGSSGKINSFTQMKWKDLTFTESKKNSG